MQAKSGQPPRKKPGRVSLPVIAPPRNAPFTGVTGLPARDTQIPNLTQHVAVAKAKVEALKNAGLVTEAKREAAVQAQQIIDRSKPAPRRTPQTAPKPSAQTSPRLPSSLTKPAVALDQPTATRRAPASTPPGSPQRRGAPPTFNQLRAYLDAHPEADQGGGLNLGAVTNYLQGPALGKSGASAVRHAIDLGAGTTIAALSPSLISDVKHPIAAVEKIKKRGLVGTNEASTELAARLGRTGVTGAIPKNFSVDVVAPAGAATVGRPVTAAELKQLENKGYDLAPAKRAKFEKQALKNGWNPAELDGISGSALIDKAFTKPAALPLRIAGNFAGGVAKLGTLPAGIEGAVRETAAGHGLKVAQALGEGLYSELPVVGKHSTADTAVADPFGFITQFAGAGKTVGALGRIGKAGAEAERVVKTASSGLQVERGLKSKNAYTALGQAISDKSAASIPRIGEKLEAEVIDHAVDRVTSKHAPGYVDVQRPYKAALDKVGGKRAAELLGYQMSGGKPEQLAAFYRAQGVADNAKFFDSVAANVKTLTEKDKTFLEAHGPLAEKTTQAWVDAGKFGPTAAKFRRYSPLIRSSAHLGNPEAQRILALRDEYLKGFNQMPEEDLAALRGALDQSVNDFATQHIKSGGSEPVYVEYSQPRPVVAPPFKPGPGGPTGFKKPRGRQKVETGATFESGKYLIDPAAPLTESVRAMRVHLADVLHGDVAKAVGTHLKAGDEIPHGHVFVSETNLRGLRRTTNDLVDNPVSQPAYDEFASQKQGIFDRLSGASVPSGERVPRGEKGYAVPIGAWKRILDHTRPPSRSAWDKTMKQYQRILVSYRPSTIVNNTLGSIPLAMTGGAGPKSFMRAAQAMRDPSLAPAILRGHGVAGSLAPSARSKVGVGMDFMRAQSARGEDFSRLATYFAKAGPTFKKRASELNMEADEYQRALARGDVDPQRFDAFLDHVEKFVGDVSKPDGAFGRTAGKAILFHRWVGHIAKLILYTLPVKHPRRLAVLLALSNYGDQYRQEHGVWPDWYREYLPLFQTVKRVGNSGKPQVFTKSFSTQGVNPFSTLNQYANPVSTGESVGDIALGVLNPLLSVPLKTAFSRPYDSENPWRYLAGQGLRQLPGVTVVRPQGGMAPDSIPFISEQRKNYSSGRKVNGKTIPLPWDLRPVARAEPGILGALLRYGLGGVYDVPAQGPIHAIDQKKHIGAMAKAARKNR
jgi:hypothetical protein